MSIAKSITCTLIGAAVKEGRIASPDDSVTRYVPSLAGSAYAGVSVRDILIMSSGVRWNETYTDPSSDRRRLLAARISQQTGSAMRVMRSLPRAAAPGTVNNYSTGETQVATEVLGSAVGRPLADYLAERIWRRYGMEAPANWWPESPGGVEIGGRADDRPVAHRQVVGAHPDFRRVPPHRRSGRDAYAPPAREAPAARK